MPSCFTSRTFKAPCNARAVAARAGVINADIGKTQAKVTNEILAGKSDELQKQTAYCRCWKSDTFPKCNGSHMKHNKETGDNVGPLIIVPEK